MAELKLDDIRQKATTVKALFSARDANLEEMRKMFHLEWSTAEPRDDTVKRTMSPSPFNDVIGAVRLMSATEPQFSVPFDEGDTDSQRMSEKLERAARSMWNASGRVELRPVHSEVAFSAILAGEIYLSVVRTADLVEHAEKTKSGGQKRRAAMIAAQTPYLFRAHNAATCYPVIDGLGLSAMYRRVQSTWGEVLDTWGELAEKARPSKLSTKDARQDKVVINTWQDWDAEAIWLDESDTPIILEENKVGFLPVVAGIADGSLLFDRPELQRLPFLYALMKSGLWKRQNLALTTVFSTIAAIGANPQLVLQSDDDRPLFIDRSVPGGVLRLRKGEVIGALNEKVYEPAQLTALELAQRLGRESTISQSALGGAPDRIMTFSEMSLLAQAGRLPLVGPKEIGGEAIAAAMMMALKWFKDSGQRTKLQYGKGREMRTIDLDPKEVPENVIIDAVLEVNLPQDKMAQVATAASAVNSKLLSRRWSRENVLGVGQSAAMDKEILFETLDEVAIQRAIEQLKQRDQMMAQQAMQQAQAGSGMGDQGLGGPPQPPTQPPPAEAGGGAMSADMEAMLQGRPMGGQIGPGMPMQGPPAMGNDQLTMLNGGGG